MLKDMEWLINDAYQSVFRREPTRGEYDTAFNQITEGNPQAEVIAERIKAMRKRLAEEGATRNQKEDILRIQRSKHKQMGETLKEI